MDDGIGQILAALKAANLQQETLVIFFSDNGGQEKWGAGPDYYNDKFDPCDQLGDNRPLRGWKGDLYEGGIRVPAAVYWQGKLRSTKVSETIGVQDWYPTIAHLIGAEMSSEWNIEGVNVWNALSGSKLPQRVFYWRTKGQFAVRKGNWKLIHTGESLEPGEAELFDLSQDSFEQRNLMQQFPEVAAELRAELLSQAALDQIHIE